MRPARCVYWDSGYTNFYRRALRSGHEAIRLTSHDVTALAIAADKTAALTGVWQTIDLDHGTVEILPMAGPRK